MKKFAPTVYFYSKKCYTFLRTVLLLPHPPVLRKMLCTRNCNAGILTEVLKYLKEKSSDENYSFLKDVALVFDSMAIRKGIMYDKKKDKFSEFVDLGGFDTSTNMADVENFE